MKAISLPASSAEPPPNATTPSCPPALKAATPSLTLASTGLGFTSENSFAGMPAAASASIAFCVIGFLARTGSVTNSGFVSRGLHGLAKLARPARRRSGPWSDNSSFRAVPSVIRPSSDSSSAASASRSRRGERRAAAGVLHAGPGEARIEIVAAVHVHGAGLDLRPMRSAASRSRVQIEAVSP